MMEISIWAASRLKTSINMLQEESGQEQQEEQDQDYEDTGPATVDMLESVGIKAPVSCSRHIVIHPAAYPNFCFLPLLITFINTCFDFSRTLKSFKKPGCTHASRKSNHNRHLFIASEAVQLQNNLHHDPKRGGTSCIMHCLES